MVAAFGRHCLIEIEGGQRLIAYSRGKKNHTVVGDQVAWVATGDEACIEQVHERRNLFYRQDEMRTKSFAANLDRVLLMIAAEPEFSESQLCRALVAAQAQRITPIIVLNKQDLTEPFERAWLRLEPYRRMGYEVLPLSLGGDGPEAAALPAHGLDALTDALRGRSTLVFGPSGSGKSTLINRLVPHAKAQTGEISQALNSGKHTTTSTRWYWAQTLNGPDQAGALIDSPGFQEFGLRHIDPSNLGHCMPDVLPYLGQCKFYNCSHVHEPGCAVLAQVGVTISAQRHRIYTQLLQELSQERW